MLGRKDTESSRDTEVWNLPSSGYRKRIQKASSRLLLMSTNSPSIRPHSPLTTHYSRFPSIIIILLIVLSATSVPAQSPRYLLETFGTRNGLLSPKIYSLKQSADRQLWIGSELGISVFNGYSFRNYQYTAANENIGRILAIAQDSISGIGVGGDRWLFRF